MHLIAHNFWHFLYTQGLTSVHTSDRRTHAMARIDMRCTEEEKERWEKLADSLGVSLSTLIRERLDSEHEHEVKAVKDWANSPVGASVLTHKLCSDCGHPKHKHGGFKTACQEERCTCGGFR